MDRPSRGFVPGHQKNNARHRHTLQVQLSRGHQLRQQAAQQVVAGVVLLPDNQLVQALEEFPACSAFFLRLRHPLG